MYMHMYTGICLFCRLNLINSKMSELGDQRSKLKVEEEQNKISSAKMNVVVFMTLLIDLLGFTVILPLMPKLLEYYGKEGSVSS